MESDEQEDNGNLTQACATAGFTNLELDRRNSRGRSRLTEAAQTQRLLAVSESVAQTKDQWITNSGGGMKGALKKVNKHKSSVTLDQQRPPDLAKA